MMQTLFSRRQWLCGTGAVAAGAVLSAGRWSGIALGATVETPTVISRRPEAYHGWPTVARRRNGELLVVCSGNREAHVCPFGRVELIRSSDEGRTWSDSQVLMDTLIDDRDAGVLETAKGSILVTTFTSLAYEKGLAAAEKIKPGQKGAWTEEKLQRWLAARDRLSADQRKAKLGRWMLRSTDGGATWSEPYDCLVSSPHGPAQLADGRVLYAGKALWKDDKNNVGVCESSDDGQTWRWLADLPLRDGDSYTAYHELHLVEAPSGKVVLQIRNHNKQNAGETLQSESTDGGRTWSTPHSIGVWGMPSHLLRLADGRLLMTYGHRRTPFGNQARVSQDKGQTWSEPIIISGDGPGGDLGYPSTVQLAGGGLLTVWYERMSDSPLAVLRQARWSL